METVESPLLPGLQGPGFAAVQKGAHHAGLVHLYFRVLCEHTACPYYACQPEQYGSCLLNASVDLGLKGDVVRDR